MSLCEYRLCPGGPHERGTQWSELKGQAFLIALTDDCRATANGSVDDWLSGMPYKAAYTWCYFMAWGEYWIADVEGSKPNYKAAALNFTQAVEVAQDEQQRAVAQRWLLLATLEGASVEGVSG